MKNFINKNKGITLIALIITIIVMLILAGISISAIVGEDGIIAQAEKAGEEQRGATVQEHRDLWKSSINTDQLSGTSSAQTLDEVVEDLKIELITEEEAEKIITEGYVVIGSRKIVFWDKLMVGDYVDYHPDIISTTYNKVGPTYTGLLTNNSNLIQDNTIKYRILNINEDTIDIIGDVTNAYLSLEGPIGYNNGVAIINDYCKAMYSNKSLGVEARSINIEDIKDKLNNFTPTNYDVEYTVTETIYPKEWPSPDNIIQEYEQRSNAIQTVTSGKKVNQNSWGNGHIIKDNFKSVNMRDKNGATYYDIFFSNKKYYLATYFQTGKYPDATSVGNQYENKNGKLYFGILFFNNAIRSEFTTFTNQAESNSITIGGYFRPIVTLPKDAINIDLDYDTEVGWKIKSNYE